MTTDTAFQMAASNIRVGQGVTAEVGMDLLEVEARRTLVLMDPALLDLPVGDSVTTSLRQAGIDFLVFDEIHVEPTDKSFQHATEVATEGQFDTFVAVGGGEYHRHRQGRQSVFHLSGRFF